MKDIPIIFSGPMVRALLDGRKTMTRRLAWRQALMRDGVYAGIGYDTKPSAWQKVKPGDRLWVRESFQLLSFGDYAVTKGQPCDIRYAATDPLADCDQGVRGYPWRPCIHLPRFASRLTLVVTATKYEPLQAISEEDAAAEGIGEPYLGDGDPPFEEPGHMIGRCQQFRNLWNRLHGTDAWAANPEVAGLTFTVHQVNIDRMTEAA